MKKILTTCILFLIIMPTFFYQGESSTVNLDLNNFGLLWTSKEGHNALSVGVSWSPDDKYIANSFYDSTVVIWNALNGTAFKTLNVANDEKVFVISKTQIKSMDQYISLGNCPNKPSCDWPSDTDNNTNLPTRTVSWSPDGKYLAVGSDDTNISIYSTTDWKIWKILTGHQGSVLTLDWSPDGEFLASGSGTEQIDPHNIPENMIKIWNISTGKCLANLIGHKDSVMSVKWSPDGKTLASAGDGGDRTVKLWNTTNWKNTLNITGHTSGVLSVDWSPDGRLLVSGSRDFTTRIWYSNNGTQKQLLWGANCQRSVSWNPNSKLIATSGPAESMLAIWNLSTGNRTDFTESQASRSTVYMCKWSHDGTKLAASSGKEHILRLYGLGGATNQQNENNQLWIQGTILFFTIALVGSALILIIGNKKW